MGTTADRTLCHRACSAAEAHYRFGGRSCLDCRGLGRCQCCCYSSCCQHFRGRNHCCTHVVVVGAIVVIRSLTRPLALLGIVVRTRHDRKVAGHQELRIQWASDGHLRLCSRSRTELPVRQQYTGEHSRRARIRRGIASIASSGFVSWLSSIFIVPSPVMDISSKDV
jgi:hypothetical protein